MQTKYAGGLVVVAACLWGAIGLFSRILTDAGMNAIQITTTRSLVTAIGLLIWAGSKGKWRIAYQDIWMFLGTGLCSVAGFNIFYFLTMTQTTLSLAAMLLYTAPFFVLLLSAVCFGERLTRQKIICSILALCGCICTTGILCGNLSVTPLGILTGVASGFCYALYSIFGKFALQKYRFETVTLYTFLVAALTLLPFSHPVELVQIAVSSPKVAIVSLLLGLVFTLLPFLLYTKGLSGISSGTASVLAFAEPLTATVLGVIVFGEYPDLFGWLGVGLLFVALVLLQRPQPLPQHEAEKIQ